MYLIILIAFGCFSDCAAATKNAMTVTNATNTSTSAKTPPSIFLSEKPVPTTTLSFMSESVKPTKSPAPTATRTTTTTTTIKTSTKLLKTATSSPLTSVSRTTLSARDLRDLQYDPDQNVGGGICFPENENFCSHRGLCLKDNTNISHYECHCFSNYGGPECQTRQKSQLTAFLLAFFLGIFGVGRFYLGYVAIGILKLLFHCGLICIATLARELAFDDDHSGSLPAILSSCACCCCCGWLIWWVHDLAVIGNGSLTAADGVGMYLDM